MGFSDGIWASIFDADETPGRSPPPASTPLGGPMGFVGSNDAVVTNEVTLLHRDASGRWVYGPEVTVERASRHRVLPRGGNREEDHSYMRIEYDFDRAELKRNGVELPATLVLSAMPPGYASIFTMPLQSAGAKDGLEKLPDAYDTDDGEAFLSRFNPLGFSAGNLASRKAESDLAAIARIAAAGRDIYLTRTSVYRAALAAKLVTEVYRDFNPLRYDTRWVKGHSKGGKDRQRLGLVPVAAENLGEVVRDIMLALLPVRDTFAKAIAKGRMMRAGQSIAVDPGLDAHLDNAIDLGVWQALAGTDPDYGVQEGDTVETLAIRYAEHHLAIWNETLRNGASHFGLPQPGDAALAGIIDVTTSPEAAEMEAGRQRLITARSERERLEITIELLERHGRDLVKDDEMIAAHHRFLRKQLRELGDDSD